MDAVVDAILALPADGVADALPADAFIRVDGGANRKQDSKPCCE